MMKRTTILILSILLFFPKTSYSFNPFKFLLGNIVAFSTHEACHILVAQQYGYSITFSGVNWEVKNVVSSFDSRSRNIKLAGTTGNAFLTEIVLFMNKNNRTSDFENGIIFANSLQEIVCPLSTRNVRDFDEDLKIDHKDFIKFIFISHGLISLFRLNRLNKINIIYHDNGIIFSKKFL